MSFDMNESQISQLITWFNVFVGYSDIQNRIARVQEKLKSIDFSSPVLNRRYSFHRTYRNIVCRNRLLQKIDIREVENHRVVSTLASLREMSRQLTNVELGRLRSRILDALSPDRDFRELEHEMRAFVHYRRAGMDVVPIDGIRDGRFDFLVRGPNGDFELECKTFSETIGNAISIDDSIIFFRAFKIALSQTASPPESGIITLVLESRRAAAESELVVCFSDFFSRAPKRKQYSDMTISFDRKAEWDLHLRTKNHAAIIKDIVERHERSNPHAMIALGKSDALMLCVSSNRVPRPILAICDRLKQASKQFSKARPAVIWGHFLATGENEFRELTEVGRRGVRPFDVIGNIVFGSEKRNHVCRLRLSADGDFVRETGYSKLLLTRRRGLSGDGPAYDLISHVSQYEAEITA